MFYNLKMSIQNLFRNGIYSVINIVGLSVSLTTVILIMLWVNDEYSYDKFHKRSKDIYLATLTFKIGDAENLFSVAPMPLAPAAKAQIPEIENACRLYDYWSVDFLKYNDNILKEVNGTMADTSFFSIFDFKIINGDVHNLFNDNYSIVLSEKTAKTLFGEEDPIGKTIEDNDGDKYCVTGIMADMPANSSLNYDVIFAFSLFESLYPQKQENWGQWNYRTYFMLHNHSNVEEVEQKLTEMQRKVYEEIIAGSGEELGEWEVKYSLLPLEKHNLYNANGTPNSKMQACKMFLISVIVLLLIACINYVNLVTARASRRNKEIFVRSVMGAKKWNLFAQFFNDSLVMLLCSLFIATLLIYLLFPFYCQITGKQLEFKLFAPQTILIYIVTFAVTSLLAGIYPALKLTQAKSLQKAHLRSFNANTLIRRILVVLQFSASVILILVAVITNRQLHFIKTMDIGYSKEHVFYVYLSQNMQKHTEVIKTQLERMPEIKGVTFTSENLSNVGHFSGGVEWEGQTENERVMFNILFVDKDFIPLMDIKLAEGTNFTGMPSDSLYCLVNRAAVKAMDMKEPIGKRISNYTDGKIIGITEDFHFKNIYEPVSPLLIIPNMWSMQVMYVKADANNIAAAIASVERIYTHYSADAPFTYQFLDEEFERVYKTDIRTGLTFNVFSLIAILISCLGLFGLVTYTAETKTKEIGIRKVMGASIANIIGMLSKEFLILVGISLCIAFPLSYYWLEKMLQDYAYRINISWLVFVFAGMITLILTLLSVGWKAFHAALKNPVKALKTNEQ